MSIEKRIHFSFDLNQPAQEDEYNLMVEPAIVERNRRVAAFLANVWDRYSNVDLTLKLALPENESDNLEYAPKFSTSLPAYLYSISGSDLGGTAKVELPSMVVRGCTNCLQHLLVIKTDHKCPICAKTMCWLLPN
ncbi:uncharacterized protein LOC123883222 [Trifolium pratense]|uniref:uncharacterized protein LOC123883222 n=1 Tax=Trifolium pratense TaxID=57577 RepID=UPI001E694024|nr:uncharacterized protein LOC123883222 [Trifolium pratense]